MPDKSDFQSEEGRARSHKNWKRNIIGGATALGVGLSLLLTGMFGSTEEILQSREESVIRQPNPVVIMMDAEEPDTGEEEQNSDQEEEDEKGVFAKMRKWIPRLPVSVRALVVVPLWCAGFGIVQGFSALWQAVSAPVLGMILKWVLAAVLIIAVYAVTVKSIFPHMPLKKILRPRNLLCLLAGTAILAIADSFLPLVWRDYPRVRSWILLLGGFAVLAAVAIPFARRHYKKKHRQQGVHQKEEAFPETEDVYVLPEGERLVFPSR